MFYIGAISFDVANKCSYVRTYLKAIGTRSESLYMGFSDTLKKKLKDKNLSQVARELEIPKTLLHEWVNAKRTPSFKNVSYLKRLADYLSLSLEELLIDGQNEKVISSVTFDDGGRTYRIKIEKVSK